MLPLSVCLPALEPKHSFGLWSPPLPTTWCFICEIKRISHLGEVEGLGWGAVARHLSPQATRKIMANSCHDWISKQRLLTEVHLNRQQRIRIIVIRSLILSVLFPSSLCRLSLAVSLPSVSSCLCHFSPCGFLQSFDVRLCSVFS